MNESEPLMSAPKAQFDVKTRVDTLLWEKPIGRLQIGLAASGVQAA